MLYQAAAIEVYGHGAPYTHKRFCRKVLSHLEKQRGPSTFDSFPMESLLRWVPDQQGYLSPLRDCSAGDVRRRFGMSVLSIAHYARLWGDMSDDMRDTWSKATPAQLLNSLRQCRDSMTEEEACWPVPDTIARHLANKGK